MEHDSDCDVSYSASDYGDYPSSEDGDYGYDPQAEPEISTRRVSPPEYGMLQQCNTNTG